jgi:hypothetical protein
MPRSNFTPRRGNSTSHTDERVHADLRTRMAPGYSGKENLHMEHDIDEKLLHMFDFIDSKYVSRPEGYISRSTDLPRMLSFFTLDVISKVAFGQTFAFLDKDDDPFGYLEYLEQFPPAINVFDVYTGLTNIMKMPLITGSLLKSTNERGLGIVMAFARERAQERFGSKPIFKQDLLDSFNNRGLTQIELESGNRRRVTLATVLST